MMIIINALNNDNDNDNDNNDNNNSIISSSSIIIHP